MKAFAGIVLYNPDITRLKNNIEAIIQNVDEVVCVDNYSSNLSKIRELLGEYNKCKLIENHENKGIAKALNQMLEYAVDNSYEWFLTLDQDSICEPELMINYEKFIELERVGIITCWIVDRNLDMNKQYRIDNSYSTISECITSGCLVNTKICQSCGGWDEILFIDGVDYEICYRMRAFGYEVIRIHQKGLLHEMGESRRVKFFGKQDLITNHSAFRHYYMARNKIYMAKKYPNIYGLKKELFREFDKFRVILMYEDDKLNKIKERIRGIRDGFKISSHSVE